MVDTDQCLMEVVEPRIVWIMPMGYKVDEQIHELYTQHLLSKPVNPSKGRFGTFVEKDLQLHSQFKKLEIVKKVIKQIEEYVESIRITKEPDWEARKRAQEFEKPVKVESTGLEASAPNRR